MFASGNFSSCCSDAKCVHIASVRKVAALIQNDAEICAYLIADDIDCSFVLFCLFF